MTALTRSCAVVGVDAVEVLVEAQVIQALRRFSIVGLPDSALRESKDRVRCAIENSGFNFPNREVVVSLAPASLPKQGTHLDLAIAVSILAADGQLSEDAAVGHLLLGELGLNGSLQPTRTTLAAAALAKRLALKGIILPRKNAALASALNGPPVLPAECLADAVRFLKHGDSLPDVEAVIPIELNSAGPSFRDVYGQYGAKRVLEISAAGGHNVLLFKSYLTPDDFMSIPTTVGCKSNDDDLILIVLKYLGYENKRKEEVSNHKVLFLCSLFNT